MAHDAADRLEDHLARERGLLLAGEVDRALRLAGEKERALAAVAANPPDLHRLERLRKEAARNQALLGATADGLKGAIATLRALRDGPEPLSTYGADGARTRVAPRSAFERRA